MTDAVSPDQPAAEPFSPVPASADPATAEPAPSDAASAPDPDHTEAEAETDDARTARQKILDHLEATDGPQHISAILQGTGLSRALADSTLSIAVKRGLVVRVAAATYQLAPPAPDPQPLPTAAELPRADGLTADEWLQHLHHWHATDEWLGPGNPPDRVEGILAPGCLCPLDVWSTFQGEIAAIEAQRKQDDELRLRLLAATGGNYLTSAESADIAVVKRMLTHAEVSVELIESAIANTHSRLNSPVNPPLRDFADLRKPVADHLAEFVLVPRLVKSWAPDPEANTARSPVLRAKLKAIAEIAPAEPAGALDTSPAVMQPQAPKSEPAALPASLDVPSDAEALLQRYAGTPTPPADVSPAPSDPLEQGRAAILAGFARGRQPQPAADDERSVLDDMPAAEPAPPPRQPPQRRPDSRDAIAERLKERRDAEGAVHGVDPDAANRPWWAGPAPRSPGQDVPGVSNAALEEYLAGFRANTIVWPAHLLGPAPGQPGCRISLEMLRRSGLV